MSEADAEVRSQAAKVVGDARRISASGALIRRLGDASPRVRYFAAIALGKLGPEARAAAGPLLRVLREDRDEDFYLRHAVVMGLAGIDPRDALIAAADDPTAAVRMGVLLAMRRGQSPEIARFLDDPEPKLVREAARAIYDIPITPLLITLAERITRPDLGSDGPLLRRIINANAWVGAADNARALAGLAARSDIADPIRVEALQILAAWAAPRDIDRVTGLWRPRPARPGTHTAADAADALRPVLPGLLVDAPDPVRLAALRALGPIRIEGAGALLVNVVADGKASAGARVEAIRALERLNDPALAAAVERAVKDPAAKVRVEGQRLLVRLRPSEALPALSEVLEHGTTDERQGALATLATLPETGADATLTAWLDRLDQKKVPPEILHDLLEAARARSARSPAVAEKLRRYEDALPKDDPLAPYFESLAGGDAEKGETILTGKEEVSCIRCHKMDGKGGEVGPDLTGIGKRQDRRYILEAIVAPNRQIAKGFETLVVATSDGQVQSGILKEDDGKNLRLITAEGKLLTIAKAEIEEQKRGASAMPEDVLKHLSRSEIRDLVEFLAGSK
jgi:quinoprotein glucose dehydrogenase